MGKKVLMLCGDYSEKDETMASCQTMLAVGYTVHANRNSCGLRYRGLQAVLRGLHPRQID